ncbi:MAG: PQQ-dependent sugar dehydrogenase [Chloroflexi bacterium]|nr:PQQ-dependent sugar dehydrogenase [Chloroflexota bacterium]
MECSTRRIRGQERRPASALFWPAALALALGLAACGGGTPAPTPTATTTATPIATATPLPEPTATPVPQPELTVFVDGVDFAVDLEFAPDGRLFYNELRTGRVRTVEGGRLQPEPLATLNVQATGEHGLLGLALDPDFQSNRYVYVFFTVPDETGAAVEQRVVRFTEMDGRGTDRTVILKGLPAGGCCHNGGRLAFGPDGKLYVSLGDAGSPDLAQDLDSLAGKILRVNRDGSTPNDNPFPGSPVYARGIRNSFGLAFHPKTGELFATDNGPAGHDELNVIVAGGNYGWPLVTGIAGARSLLDPIFATGDDSIAPTGVTVYRGHVYFCSYNDTTLLLVPADEVRAVRRGEKSAVQPRDTGLPCGLDVTAGPDGALYFSDGENIYRWGL